MLWQQYYIGTILWLTSRWSTAIAKAISVGHCDGVTLSQAWLASRGCITQPEIMHRRFATQGCRSCMLESHHFKGGELPRCMDGVVGCGLLRANVDAGDRLAVSCQVQRYMRTQSHWRCLLNSNDSRCIVPMVVWSGCDACSGTILVQIRLSAFNVWTKFWMLMTPAFIWYMGCPERSFLEGIPT